MELGSIVVAGISAVFLLLALTYINVYTVFVMRRKQYEYYKETQRLAALILEERDRLIGEVSRDVHDNIGQLTHVLRMSYHRMFKDIDEGLRSKLQKDSAELIDRIAYHARNIRYTLDSDYIRSRGLAEMLRRDAGLIESAGLTLCSVNINGTEGKHLGADMQLVIYRIAQEALHNALKHAEAQRINIHLHYGDSGFSLKVEDDGAGFDPGNPGAMGGVGIANMQKRAGYLGGVLAIDAAPGKGTVVTLTIPRQKLDKKMG